MTCSTLTERTRSEGQAAPAAAEQTGRDNAEAGGEQSPAGTDHVSVFHPHSDAP